MNKTIYILWFQGFDKAPDIVKQCVKSWKYYNPTWNIIMLDNNNLSEYMNLNDYIDLSNAIQPSLCHKADVVRTVLLKNYGGLWVDATTFCNKSLNDWLPKYIGEGFFAFNKPTADRLLSNWFLYANKDSYIMNQWYNSTISYYKTHKRAETYYIHHYLFGNLYKSDDKFKTAWNNVPKISANIPHKLLNIMFNHCNQTIKNDINSKISPLYKLSHHNLKHLPYNNNIILFYLYSTINTLL